MRRAFVAVLIGMGLFASSFFLIAPQPAMAAAGCECYCSDPGNGAKRIPNATTALTSEDCTKQCAARDLTVAVCAYTLTQRPEFNAMCFTADQCSKQGGIQALAGKSPRQPGECKKGMFYCYPNPNSEDARKTRLQVSIGDYEFSDDFGEYIAIAYRWMLGAGTTMAIVFLMVAGLRWSLGGLSSDQVSRSKKTIGRVVMGLVLLMSTYLILYTVNPYLIRLSVPEFPMIKTISLLDGANSCGYLKGVWGGEAYLTKNGAPLDSPYANRAGYTIENETKGAFCGSVAEVTTNPDGTPTLEDTTCTFDYCAGSGERCFVTADQGYCLTCEDFKHGSSPPVPASAQVCGQLSNPDAGETCVFVSRNTFSSSVVSAALSYMGYSEDPAVAFEDPTCYACSASDTCTSIRSQELCNLDPCQLGCRWEITDLGITVGGGARSSAECVKG